MPENAEEQKLPRELAETIGKTLFNYDGRLNSLSDSEMLNLSDALAPYYPPGDEETAAALTLREWLLAKEVRAIAEKPFKELRDLVGSGVDQWRMFLERISYERRERVEGRFTKEDIQKGAPMTYIRNSTTCSSQMIQVE